MLPIALTRIAVQICTCYAPCLVVLMSCRGSQPGRHTPAPVETCRWRPHDLADVLSAAMGQESAWDRKDADTLLSVVRLLEDGFARCAFSCSAHRGMHTQQHASCSCTHCTRGEGLCSACLYHECWQWPRRLHELDASLAATRLAQGTGVLVSFLAAEQEGVRFAAAQALQSILRTCLDAKVSPLIERCECQFVCVASMAVHRSCPSLFQNPF
jgi:hypothetical protein